MQPLFDFGISQEDPSTEYSLLDIKPGDHLLCIASGGEIPLSLFCLQPGIRITAVDVSTTQLSLCRFKLLAARSLPFPMNGAFLGYSFASAEMRKALYFEKLRNTLQKEEQCFWDKHINCIEKGVVNTGRFENYMARLRKAAQLLIGKKNLERLLQCASVNEQEQVFDEHIATRRAVNYLFSVAFHPLLYRNRGVSEKGLLHTKEKTGELFFRKFRSFCVATPAKKNYFLQYFLSGSCLMESALPEFLSLNERLAAAEDSISWKRTDLTQELRNNPTGTYNKVHLSNIGDWLEEEDFSTLYNVLLDKCPQDGRIVYRYLHKNHLAAATRMHNGFTIGKMPTEHTDRFPFYETLLLTRNG